MWPAQWRCEPRSGLRLTREGVPKRTLRLTGERLTQYFACMSASRGMGLNAMQRTILRMLGLADLADAPAAARAAQRAAAIALQVLARLEDAQLSSQPASQRHGGAGDGRRGGLEEDVEDSPYPR